MSTISSTSSASRQLASEGVRYAGAIASAATRHGLDPRLLAAVAAQETGGPGSNAGSNVVGDGGHGHGVFQIDDRYHDFARSSAAMDPAANADYAAGMLSGLLQRYGGNVHMALSAYNAGSPSATGTVTAWQDGRHLGYADSVMAHYAQLGGTPTSSLTGSGSAAYTDLQAESQAESQAEQSNVNSLLSFAMQQQLQDSESSALSSLQAPQIPQDASQYTYRQMAGLDNNGNSKQNSDYTAVVDPEAASDDDGP